MKKLMLATFALAAVGMLQGAPQVAKNPRPATPAAKSTTTEHTQVASATPKDHKKGTKHKKGTSAKTTQVKDSKDRPLPNKK